MKNNQKYMLLKNMYEQIHSFNQLALVNQFPVLFHIEINSERVCEDQDFFNILTRVISKDVEIPSV